MSRFLFVTLEGCSLSDGGIDGLARAVADRCVGGHSAKMARELRLVRRQEPFGLSLEAFIGSAGCLELLSISRKRPQVIELLSALVTEAAKRARSVGIVCVSASHESFKHWPTPQSGVCLEKALDRARKEDVWMKLQSPLRLFHFPRAEARLKQPRPVAGTTDLATHYFREFWIRACSKDDAVGMIREVIASDEADLVHADGDDCDDTQGVQPNSGSDESAGIVRMSGRVFFSD